MIRFFSVISLFVSSAVFAAPGDIRKNCQKFEEPLMGGACVHVQEGSNNPDVLYHLHGMGGDEETWSQPNFYTQQIRDYWKSKGQDLPIVVSVSFGPVWLLIDKNTSSYSGLLPTFKSTVLPTLEKSFGGVKGRRLLLGESMGGINSLQLLLRSDLFDKVAAVCAPVTSISPHWAQEKIDETVKNSTAWKVYKDKKPSAVLGQVQKLLMLSEEFFPSQKEWEANDLSLFIANNDISKVVPSYISAGFHDEYLAFEGNQHIAAALKAQGAEVEWHPAWGGHCSVDIGSISEFLSKRE